MASTLNSTTPNSPHSITAVIIARNEEGMIVNCIETLRWADEILVLDTGSKDRTRGVAQRAGARVEQAHGTNFSEWRNEAAELVTTAWILYIDADERVTPALARTIQNRVPRTDFDAYTIHRNNIHMGRWMQHGGWNNDELLRLVKKEKLRTWVGEVHEHAEITGRIGQIDEPLVHLTHRSLYDGLKKSIDWTDVEAQLMLEVNHPRITPLRLFKIVIFDIINRLVFKMAWKDGHEGVIEAMVQTMNRFLVYVRLWELQQKPSLEKRYDRIELEIQKQWNQQ
ncbi:glycosyltransferase family 2 protein [Candidatus Woesebacteria bacterium]|nr:glycosyltransferase family 2 protein [Candidatus Woesebacteria bacterium]MCD8507174.1 glycosyltransferase family 2 protein [Candidatus Woesebacteria bacterium]MCD8527065.1 glycosyltransferase family 2 protein [Candidatus Woesebacteria bacterium]MCD8545933.1 glycosyltransferase family 2 protein [Candidatus Woesebacteria bacterium]